MSLSSLLERWRRLDWRGFVRWWGSELVFLVPAAVQHWWRGRQSRLLMVPEGSDIAFFLRTDNGVISLGHCGRDELDFACVEKLLASYPDLADLERALLLGDADVLRRTMSLPAAARGSLLQVVGFELDRYTPFKAGALYHDVRLLSETAEGGRLQIEFAAVLRTELDQLLEWLGRRGLQPSVVDIAAAQVCQSGEGYGFNLLPAGYREQGSRWPRIATYAGASVLCILFAAVGALPVMLDEAFMDDLRDQQRRLTQASKAVETQREEVEGLQKAALFVLEKKLSQPPAIALLQDITKRLPDDTWVSTLQVRERRLEMQGQSNSSSALIAALEASPYLNNTAFLSPVTPDRVSGQERFRVGADIVASQDSEDYGRGDGEGGRAAPAPQGSPAAVPASQTPAPASTPVVPMPDVYPDGGMDGYIDPGMDVPEDEQPFVSDEVPAE